MLKQDGCAWTFESILYQISWTWGWLICPLATGWLNNQSIKLLDDITLWWKGVNYWHPRKLGRYSKGLWRRRGQFPKLVRFHYIMVLKRKHYREQEKQWLECIGIARKTLWWQNGSACGICHGHVTLSMWSSWKCCVNKRARAHTHTHVKLAKTKLCEYFTNIRFLILILSKTL